MINKLGNKIIELKVIEDLLLVLTEVVLGIL